MTEPSQYFKGRTVQEQMNEVIGYVDTRAAEVATAAIASDVAQVHQDKLDADADAQAAAASAAAAAGTLANAVKKTGEASQSIAGDIAVAGDLSAGGDATAVNIRSTGTLYANNDASVGRNLGVGGSTSVVDLTATGNVSVPTPTGNNYAANKKYVDDSLDAYVPMLRTTGTQTLNAIKDNLVPWRSRHMGPSFTSSTTLCWKRYLYTTITGTNHNLVILLSRFNQGPAIIAVNTYTNASQIVVTGFGATGVMDRLKVTYYNDGTTTTLSIWINVNGSNSGRYLANILDGYQTADWIDGGETLYTHDPNAKTFTDENGNVLYYSDMLSVSAVQ